MLSRSDLECAIISKKTKSPNMPLSSKVANLLLNRSSSQL